MRYLKYIFTILVLLIATQAYSAETAANLVWGTIGTDYIQSGDGPENTIEANLGTGSNTFPACSNDAPCKIVVYNSNCALKECTNREYITIKTVSGASNPYTLTIKSRNADTPNCPTGPCTFAAGAKFDLVPSAGTFSSILDYIKAINGFVQCNGTTCTAATTMNITSIDMSAQTSSIPWIVGTSAWPTAEGSVKWDSANNILYIGDGATSQKIYPTASLPLTSETSHTDVVVDGDFTSEGLVRRGASGGVYSIVTDNSANWNTAYGWGNHASGGYQLVHTYLQISTPSSPSSGYTKLYFKSDDKLYKKTSVGAETEIGSGTASAITVTNHTTNGTITCENGNVHTNNGASETITLRLASMTEAQHCMIKRISAYRINIEPNVETDEIKEVTSGAGKGAYTESDWGQIDLLSYVNTKMVPINAKGTWTEYNPDYTPPTLTSATIPSAGTSISLLFGETVTRASETGWLMTMTGGASAMTYASGSGSNTLVYNLAREVQSDETGVLDWTAQANTIEDVNGNDLATIDDHAVTNNSTQALPTVSSITIGTNGTSWTFAYSEAVTCTSTPNCCDDFTAAMTIAGAITLSYASGSGSNSVVCTGTPTVGIGDTIANGGADYTTVSNGIEDATGNDLASFTDKAVTNNSAVGDSCTGTLLFSWHGETTDVTTGTPSGCSVGDTTGTAVSSATISTDQYWDGSHSVSIPTGDDYYIFSVSGNDIFSPTEGTIYMKIRAHTFASGPKLFSATINANNKVEIALTGTDEVWMGWYGNAVYQGVTTTNANIALDTWYTVTAKYNTANVNPNLWIQVCDTDNANCSTAISNNTNLTALVGTITDIRFGGDLTGNYSDRYMDTIKIYNSVTP